MNILFTICGRAGSKGIENKNIRQFCGHHLSYYAVSIIDLYVKRHPEITFDVVVNSDSKELLEIVTNNKMLPVEKIERVDSLSGDFVGKIAVIQDCLTQMENRKSIKYDMVVDLDITSPLRTVKDLEKVIEKQIDKNADVTTTVSTARRNPYFNQVKRTGQGVKKVIEANYSARQQAPEIFDMNASIYAYKPEYLSSGKGVLDGYCEIVEMYDTGILDLDHENDFELMEVIARHLFEKYEDFKEVKEHIITKLSAKDERKSRGK